MTVQTKTVNGGTEAGSGFNINEFRSQITGGLLRNSNFICVLHMPPGLQSNVTGTDDNFNDTSKKMQFHIEAASLPGIGMATDEIRRYGHGNVILRPYAPVFDVIDIMVRVDAAGSIYDMFQAWMKLILNTDEQNGILNSVGFNGARTFELNYPVAYRTLMEVKLFDDEGNEAVGISLDKAWPIYMGPIALNWGDPNSISKFPVKIAYSSWSTAKNIRGTQLPVSTPLANNLSF